jgi:DNA-directed RNA polymerase subunit beta'
MVNLGAWLLVSSRRQIIGEPGTQRTLRTFHTGGVAAAGDITTGSSARWKNCLRRV